MRPTRALGIELSASTAKPRGCPRPCRQDAKPPALIEGVRHDVERPRVVQHGRRGPRLPQSLGHARLRPSGQVQPQGAIHAMHPFVIPPMALQPQPIEAPPEASPAVIRDHSGQGRNDGGVGTDPRHQRPVVRRPRQPHHATRSWHRALTIVGDIVKCCGSAA